VAAVNTAAHAARTRFELPAPNYAPQNMINPSNEPDHVKKVHVSGVHHHIDLKLLLM
jgi:hypothetical protein